ncbi:MAG: hypothetical protein ACREJO_04970 [Phycisphaerales bacterium]
MAQPKKAKSASEILRDGKAIDAAVTRAVQRAVAKSPTRPASAKKPAAARKRRAA